MRDIAESARREPHQADVHRVGHPVQDLSERPAHVEDPPELLRRGGFPESRGLRGAGVSAEAASAPGRRDGGCRAAGARLEFLLGEAEPPEADADGPRLLPLQWASKGEGFRRGCGDASASTLQQARQSGAWGGGPRASMSSWFLTWVL